MKAVITGANGFIGKNLALRLKEQGADLYCHGRNDDQQILLQAIEKTDIIFHLAGENRSKDESLFEKNNVDFTRLICTTLRSMQKPPSLLFSSSAHATKNTVYAKTKRAAEEVLKQYSISKTASVSIFRLPAIFGKWSKPNYNSVVSTFCHNIAREKDIEIHSDAATIELIHIDDVVDLLISEAKSASRSEPFSLQTIPGHYKISIGDLARTIKKFKSEQTSLFIPGLNDEFERKLYSTYLSYVPANQFSHTIQQAEDERGTFIECAKTKHSGQFSYFSINPGMTRGGHYHHQKFERFIVVHGSVEFEFINISTNETMKIQVDSSTSEIVHATPGWQHYVSNLSTETTAGVLVWANEIFDPANPDTFRLEK